MATSLRTRKKSSVQPTVQELTLLLVKAIGLDLTGEYDPDAFASFAVDMYQSPDPEVYTEQGQYLYNLLQSLYAISNLKQETAITPVERTTKVWFQHSLQVADLKDSELVDSLLVYPTTLTTVFDSEGENLSFLAVKVDDD